jgi:1-aminocyclopropane-1-carboxylate deaminase
VVHPEYLDFTKHVKSHFFCHVKRWRANNEWEAGNKWFKLKYNWLQAEEKGYASVVSIGGAWSNHLSALAFAGQKMGWKTIGLVRGAWRIDEPTTAMLDMERCGMQLVGLDTAIYDIRDTEDFKVWIRDQYPGAFYIPEGGANYWGLMGAMEMLDAQDKLSYDDIWVAGGTGTTAAGILLSAGARQRIHVVFALKAPLEELRAMISSKLSWIVSDQEELNDLMERVIVYSDVEFGGYGKANTALFDWINHWSKLELPLDRVYTAKLWWYLQHQNESVLSQRRTLFVHTGGLQGNRSFISF